MRVLIDALGAPGHPRGVGRYVHELSRALARIADTSVLVACGRWHRGFYASLAAHGVELIEVELPSPGRLSRHAWHLLRLPWLARAVRADVIHVPDRALATPPHGTALVVTIHDVAEHDLAQAYGPVQLRYRRLVLGRQLQRAGRIVTPSRFTADRLASVEPRVRERTTVVVNGPGIDPATPSVAPEESIRRPFLLFVGAIQRHKNAPRVTRAFRSLAERSVGLVVAGADHNDRAALEQAMAGDPRIQRLPRPSDGELVWLYGHAVGLIFPSLYEGFGLPILEAMSFGCPVVTSDRGAPRELAADAALLIDPLDEGAIGASMKRLLEDADLRDRLAAAGRERVSLFSWGRAAGDTVAVYREALAEVRA